MFLRGNGLTLTPELAIVDERDRRGSDGVGGWPMAEEEVLRA